MVAQEATVEADVLKQKGPLQEISQPLDDLMDLNWQSGRLALDIKDSYKSINPIVESISQIVGRGGRSSQNSTRGFLFEFNGTKISGQIKREKNRTCKQPR